LFWQSNNLAAKRVKEESGKAKLSRSFLQKAEKQNQKVTF
jgi:hypothetical protein